MNFLFLWLKYHRANLWQKFKGRQQPEMYSLLFSNLNPSPKSYLEGTAFNYEEWQKELPIGREALKGVYSKPLFPVPHSEKSRALATSTLCCLWLHPTEKFQWPRWFAIHLLVVSASPFPLTWCQKHMVVNSPTDGCRELSGSRGKIWPADVWLHHRACAAHKPCEWKYLQDEYKKHKTRGHKRQEFTELLHFAS